MLSFQQGGQVVDILLMHLFTHQLWVQWDKKPNQPILKPFYHSIHYYRIHDIGLRFRVRVFKTLAL